MFLTKNLENFFTYSKKNYEAKFSTLFDLAIEVFHLLQRRKVRERKITKVFFSIFFNVNIL